MPTLPPTVTPWPTPPQTNDFVNFDTRADAFLSAFPSRQAEMDDLAGNVYDNAVEAHADAVAADNLRVLAAASAAAAAASATTAVNAPGTAGTSSSSISVGTGSKTLTTQTGKAFVVGQTVIVARTSAPATTRMSGIVTGYTTGTGVIVVQVTEALGSGTFTDWTISLGTAVAPRILPIQLISADTTAVSGVHYVFAASCKLTLPSAWSKDDVVEFSLGAAGLSPAPQVDFGSTKLRGQSPGLMTITDHRIRHLLQHTGNSTIGLV